MAQHDFSSLKDQFPGIIEQLPQEFTSHRFILLLAHQNQALYIEALNAYRNINAPFQTVHQVLSTSLRDFSDLVEYIEETNSQDIWRNSNRCSMWRKI